ncbi:MAG: prolyl oligopeptidase family serine peptidase [Lysobacterales bacterium]|jgi:dipeptidyl aminopeptidase/acylaminoacyl peptidase
MKLRLLMGLALTLALTIQTAAAKELPLDHFFKNPEFAGFQLSPDGKRLAAMVNLNGRMNLAVIDLATRKSQAVTNIKRQDVSGFMWANNDRLLFFMDKDGNESFGIFAVNADGSYPRTLVEPPEAMARSGRASEIRIVQVLDILEDEPEWVLVQSNERRASNPDVFKLNIMTEGQSRGPLGSGSNTQLVQRNPGNVAGWFTDWDGNLIGASFQDGLNVGFMMLTDRENDTWETVLETRFDEPGFAPAAITGDGVHGYVTSNLTPDGKARDKAALYEYNFETREFGDLVYEHDVVDCCNPIMNRKARKLIGVSYMVGKPEMVYLDPVWKSRMDAINRALPDTINRISSLDDEETIAVVTSSSSTQPPKYYLFDMINNKLEWMADSRPWVDASVMAEMKPYSFKARDGRELHGYLTIPHGSDGKNLPLIVNPHGGPWARDGYSYNPEHQFLANRGYAVIQVNFRGSTGFGMDHMQSAFKQWGQSMQDDVTDAVKWAIDQGIADADRVCIYGGSYGGYAAMAGLTFTPELYKCGINYVGVTSIPLLFETMPDAWGDGAAQMKAMVGDPETEREFLEQWSPVHHADKIQAPVFMAYGRRDPRVNIEHAKIMEKALKKNNVEYELMIKRNEGHGFRKEENRYDFYGTMEKFLAENLK